MTNRAIAHARLRASRLLEGGALASAIDVVRWFGAVQSQDVPGAMWAVAQRLPPGTTLEAIGHAFDAGEIVRTHAMRPTWHFIAPDDLRWIQDLTGPRVRQANAAINRRALQLTETDFDTAARVLRSELSGGRVRTRDELREPWLAAGVAIREPLALAYLAMEAELRAIICSGPRRGRQPTTYMLIDERIPPAPPRERDDALRALTIRYFTSHGPALVRDMSWWSGLTITDVRRGIELAGGALERRAIEDGDYIAAVGGFEPPDVPAPFIRLLSNYDEVVGSYADYGPVLEPGFAAPNWTFDAVGPHVLMRDGLIVGGWRRALTLKRITVTVTAFTALDAAERAALDEEAERFARFFGLPVDLRMVEG